MKPYFLAILSCFCFIQIYSQDEVKFELYKQHYLKGDAFYFGNNILSKNNKTPYGSFGVINDAISMKYIDIDSDTSTFSSSKATYNLKDEKARIVSATLYWTAVYPYSRGGRGVKNNTYYYKETEERTGDYTQIKFKTPESKKYLDVKGNILFDGINNKNYKDNAPYVCYADVTDLMPKQSNGNGEYSVANIRATEGFVSGGSTAGWFLFIVYESDLQESRYITAYNGFSSLSDNSVDIDFKNFKTKSNGTVNATVFVATLEGDSKLSRDQCGLFNPETNNVQYFQNKLRAQSNFFNGKLTIDDKYFTKRTPNGANTLGFDVAKLRIPKNLIKNNQENTTLRLGSRADRFYFYFTAFKTEINEDFHKLKIEESLEIVDEEKDITNSQIEIQESGNIKPELNEEKVQKILKSRKLNIPNLKSGYYIITNVFSIKTNADKWKEFLISKGHNAEIFQNPKNNWYYVHIYNDIDVFKVYKSYQKLVKLEYFEEIWVFKIN